jgi:allophanate hydrolase subunit 2
LDGLAYTLSPLSNRVAARLAGPALTRAVAGELAPEGLVLGAIQVPADGQPLVFLADHPTTGGYPVVGVVHPADLPSLAQARPGAAVVFRTVDRPGSVATLVDR